MFSIFPYISDMPACRIRLEVEVTEGVGGTDTTVAGKYQSSTLIAQFVVNSTCFSPTQ